MSIAMLTAARLAQGVPQWIEACAPRRLAARLLDGYGRVRHRARLRAVPSRPRHVLPLRVLRVVEPQQARCDAGRMVISGRMADVCAELDRLAAAEAHARQP